MKWNCAPRARLNSRAHGGFGDYLRDLVRVG